MTMALYIRTSTWDQLGEAQLNALRRAAEARGWVDVKEFIDLGHSGAKAHRPALDKLRDAAQAGEVRQVLVFALDRLGRSLRDLHRPVHSHGRNRSIATVPRGDRFGVG